MSQTPKTSDRRLGQLEDIAESKATLGEATTLECAIPELVAEIFALREERDRNADERRVAIELINAEGLTGDYVHRLDSEGLLAHTGRGPERSGSSGDAVLHLYPLADEHGDSRISANTEALRTLRTAIQRLLEHHGPLASSGGLRVFAADGEAYDLVLEKREGGPHAAPWEELPEPYYVSRRRARESGMDV